MNVHFIAIGGSIMHQLAIALKLKGHTVTGSDDEIFEPAKSNLEKQGILPASLGWFPGKINNKLDAVILGMHAKENNPELMKARELSLKIYSFPEYIYKESINKTRIAIAGSHGKTTTTAMIMHVLKNADKEFDYLVGAKLAGFNVSVNITEAPVIVCEADEYPASIIEKRPKFHFLFPHIAVITGIAWDHINVFPTLEVYIEQFKIFVDEIEPGGLLIYNETDETLKNLVEKNRRADLHYQPYGLPSHFIKDGVTGVVLEGKQSTLNIFGNHNLLNLHAAFYVCKQLGVEASVFIKEITDFSGAANRLELIASSDTTNIYRDFAHAPSKVKASIEAVKQQFTAKRLIAILELHTYSSLNSNFMKQYNGALDQADIGIVFYSPHALELKRMPSLSKEKVIGGFGKEGLYVFTAKNELETWLRQQNYTNTNLLFMSSGNYDGLDIKNVVLSKAVDTVSL
jgi:UDP-N-acetylmuramate: L-alanyl-gamma-D-glutamyl-meso-diaminopimelate ligase